MAKGTKQAKSYKLHDFPVVLSALLFVLFIISWILALSEATALKPVHYTLFNFLLVAIFALQKYRRFEMDVETQSFRLVSLGLLSGKHTTEAELSLITQVKVEPGIGGITGKSGHLLLCLEDQQPVVLSNTDLRPGSHQKLMHIRDEIEQWLRETQVP